MNGKFMRFISKNFILLPFLIILAFLCVLYPDEIINYPDFVDWQTIASLAGLLVVATAIKESSYFLIIAERTLEKVNSERKIALVLVLLSCILASFLTNDVALFIVIPFTLGFQAFMENDVRKLIIFEAMAVNVGSALTPIGNPQNLFLWHQWGVSFLTFIIKMMPLFILLFISLIIFVLIAFPPKRLHTPIRENDAEFNKKLFSLSILLLIGYALMMQLGLTYYALPAILLIYLISFRNILPKVDWLLILLFITLFIDFHLIGRTEIISNFVNSFSLDSSSTIFSLSLLFSQITSNVPASILMSKFSHNWFSIAYGVNVGGNGIAVASLANLIALRFAGGKKIWADFHKYSLLYLIVTGVLAYVIFFM